jgi:death on curing protein
VSDWVWLSREAVDMFHQQQLVEHGGLPGIKDENALEAALARPINKAAYEEPDVFELAAAYLFGIVEATQGEVIEFVLGVASGEIDETGAAMFFKDFCVSANPSEAP